MQPMSSMLPSTTGGHILDVLELANALMLAIIASEWTRTQQPRRIAVGLALLLLANFSVVLAVIGAVVVFVWRRRDLHSAARRLGLRGAGIVCGALLALCALVAVAQRCSVRARTDHRVVVGALWMLKLATFAVVYCVAGYAELRVFHVPRLGLRAYARSVLLALRFVLPLYPFLVVIASTVMMFFVTIIEHSGLNSTPVHAALNAAIYFGTLFGPFSVSYVSAKRRCMEEHAAEEDLPR